MSSNGYELFTPVLVLDEHSLRNSPGLSKFSPYTVSWVSASLIASVVTVEIRETNGRFKEAAVGWNCYYVVVKT